MIDRQAILHYDSGEHMATTIRRTRPAYDKLIETLSRFGTEVARDRVLETDTIAPYNFIRKGRVELVFPPQPEAGQMRNENGEISGTMGQLVVEKAARDYDESLVTGHLVIEYNDANNWTAMSVVDVHGESIVPDEVIDALGEVFTAYDPVETT